MSSILCSKLSALYIRAQSVWSGWPVYEVKCLCSLLWTFGCQGHLDRRGELASKLDFFYWEFELNFFCWVFVLFFLIHKSNKQDKGLKTLVFWNNILALDLIVLWTFGCQGRLDKQGELGRKLYFFCWEFVFIHPEKASWYPDQTSNQTTWQVLNILYFLNKLLVLRLLWVDIDVLYLVFSS